MSQEVFNRYESKFLIDRYIWEKIQTNLQNSMEPDKYNKNDSLYTISNIYYDSEDHYLIRNSLLKPKYKEKLRLRAYGVPKRDEKVYVEIKKKYYGLVNKRRTALKLQDAYNFLNSNIKPDIKPYFQGQSINYQVINEIDYMIGLYKLIPQLYLSYQRKAFWSKDQKDLRITFDTNIRTRRYNLRLEAGNYGDLLLPIDKCIMEVKAENSIPTWLARLLSELSVYKTSFSKYGSEYTKMLKQDNQNESNEILLTNKSKGVLLYA